MSELLRCAACGGAVVWDAGRDGAACLFCGTVALELQVPEDPLPTPQALLPARIDVAEAERRFRTWIGNSWFRPAALRSAAIELQFLAIPAWVFESELESHWAGLRRAATRSGKEPVSGMEHARMRHMVPASGGLELRELTALQPFDEGPGQPWDPASVDGPWEPPVTSERRARIQAHADLAERHRVDISHTRGLTRCLVSPLITDLDTRLLMLPVYIGTFRHRDRPWRFVVNGHSGVVVGDAPLDRRKVAAVVVAVLLLVVLLALYARQ
ncbi:MAG: hypothetical protein KC431_15425 [Myxococcales bacterium]|nr:hypothetical protein [Myxococcales bacterium]